MEECVVESRALKSSFLSQKTSSQVVNDLWSLAAATNSVLSDDFPVEDLLNLDFSDKDLQDDACFLMEHDDVQKAYSNDYSSFLSGADEFDSFSTGGELSVPGEDLENLEWLSQFVDDSATGFSLGNFIAKTEAARGASNRVSKPVQKTRNSWFPTKVSRKPRSIPVQKTRNSWSLAISSELGSSSLVSSCSSGSTTMSRFVFTNPVQDMELLSSVENRRRRSRR